MAVEQQTRVDVEHVALFHRIEPQPRPPRADAKRHALR